MNTGVYMTENNITGNNIMEKYLPAFDSCLQHEKPFCMSECPLHLDVYEFIDRIREGRFNAAYKAFRNAAGFPAIAAELCSGPCRAVCPLHAENAGAESDAIELNLLERACIEYADKKEPTAYNLPRRSKKIAVAGAGISGMACALRLATKMYSVTIFEKADEIGGTLKDIMDADIYKKDFELQMKHLETDLRCGCEITSADQLTAEGFDAVYLATGKGGTDLSVPLTDDGEPCMMLGDAGLFAGGSLLGHDKIHALGDGLAAATAIDNFLMTGNLIYPTYRKTKMVLDESRITPGRTAAAADGCDDRDPLSISRNDAVHEAERCLRCQCDSCRIYCDLTEYVHKWPLRIRDEILATTAPGSADIKATPAKRLINTCTHCGLCKDTCPQDIDLGGLILSARSKMHKLGKMPWVFNDFFLRDMAFSNSEAACLCRPAPCADHDSDSRQSGHENEKRTCTYAFFPGCQLGASDPELVSGSYKHILEHEKDTGIMLGCCGVPAVWAGDDILHDGEISRIKTQWESLGRPTMILACPTCMNNFQRYLPEVKTVFLYDLMAEWMSANAGSDSAGGTAGPGPADKFAIFDPCATNDGDSVRRSVRKICSGSGIQTVPLPQQEQHSACCSYGGHGSIADSRFADMVRERRISESDAPYIVYCINCRDAFLGKGKPTYHILDLLLGREPRLSTATKRRENRIEMKEKILKEIYRESPADADSSASAGSSAADAGSAADETDNIRLEISDELKEKISSEHMLEEDIRNVVAFCERTGRSVYDTEKDTFSGYRKIGRMTHWVEYRRSADPSALILVNAYSHRMEIELELIWNGEKIDTDVQ